MNSEQLYRDMMLIRQFEQAVFTLFSQGKIAGTTHAYTGQEANAVALCSVLQQQDLIVSNHRCHGHYLARTGDVRGLLAEMLGRDDGVCAGRGGSQHLCNGQFFSNGVQGNMVPVAAGMAYAEKLKKDKAIVVLFIGDGTFGQGVVYETLNLLSLWHLPVLVVVENNWIAQTTPLHHHMAGTLSARAEAFDVLQKEIDSTDVEHLVPFFKSAVTYVRNKCRPCMAIVDTYRLCGHSKGDDYRDPVELEFRKQQDPLTVQQQRVPAYELIAVDTQRIVDEALAGCGV